MIGKQLIDQYARNISDEKQHSVSDGASAGTEKRYQVLYKDYQDPDALRKLAASIKDHTLHHLGDYLAQAEQALLCRSHVTRLAPPPAARASKPCAFTAGRVTHG